MDVVSRVIYKVETKLFIVERIRGRILRHCLGSSQCNSILRSCIIYCEAGSEVK